MRRSVPGAISTDLHGSRRNLQILIEMLPADPSMTIVEPLLALMTDLRMLERRIRIEGRTVGNSGLRSLNKKSWIMIRATSILNDRYHRDLIVDPAKELVRMRLFVAEMDSDLTNSARRGD